MQCNRTAELVPFMHTGFLTNTTNIYLPALICTTDPQEF